MSEFCTHYACRCARARELAIMADRTGDNSLLMAAVEVHSQQVRCRASTECVAKLKQGES